MMNTTRSKIILGTVQFGLNYGISNKLGKPAPESIAILLDYAYEQGVRILDSADAYGDAPELIGNYHNSRPTRFEIITKFKAGPDFNAEDWLNGQLEKFSIRQLYACMFHDFQDYYTNQSVVSDLKVLVKKGLIQKIGVSVYTNEQVAEASEDENISLIQLPFNLLDNTFQRGHWLAKAQSKGKEIHVRSVFLQGLFFLDTEKLPEKLIPLKPDLEKLHQLANQYGIPLAGIALAYAASNQTVDKFLIGVDSLDQLKNNLNNLDQTLPDGLLEEIDAIKVESTHLLNPTNWT